MQAYSHRRKLDFTWSIEMKVFRVGYFVNNNFDQIKKLFYALRGCHGLMVRESNL